MRDAPQEVVGGVARVLLALRGVERGEEGPELALLAGARGDLGGADRVGPDELERARVELHLARS